MTTHDESIDDTTMSFARVLGRYRLQLSLLGVVVAMVLIVIQQVRDPDPPVFQVEALVVGSNVEVELESLPATVEAIFESVGVAESAASRAATGIDAQALIPDIASLVGVEGTAIFEIRAEHRDAGLAATYANAVAAALVDDMNRIEPGFGAFAIHDMARVPTVAVRTGQVGAVLGALSVGFAVALGVAALVALWSSTTGLAVGFEPDAGVAEAAALPADAAPFFAAHGIDVEPQLEVGTQQRRASVTRTADANTSVSASDVTLVRGIGPSYATLLSMVGVRNIGQLADADAASLAVELGISSARAEEWVDHASELVAG